MTKRVRLSVLVSIVVLLVMAVGVSYGEEEANLYVGSQNEIFECIKAVAGEGEEPDIDTLEEIKVNFQTFLPSENYLVCTNNDDGTCRFLLVLESRALLYRSLQLDDAKVASAIVMLNADKITAREVRYCCEKGIWDSGSPVLIDNVREALAMGEELRDELLASGRISASPTATAAPTATIAEATPAPTAIPRSYQSMEPLPFSPSYQEAKTRLERLEGYLDQYDDAMDNIPRGALIEAAGVQLWDIPIESGYFGTDNCDYIFVMDPSVFTDDPNTQLDWYVNAFRMMYENLQAIYGDYSDYCIVGGDQTYGLEGNPDYGSILWLMKNTADVSINFVFGDYELSMYNAVSWHVGLTSTNRAVPRQTTHTAEPLLADAGTETFSKQDCSAIVFPKYDKRLRALTKNMMEAPKTVTFAEPFPLSKLGNEAELERYYAYTYGMRYKLSRGVLADLNLCKTTMFGFRIDTVYAGETNLILDSDTIRFYPHIEDTSIDGQLQMLDALYRAMKSKLGAATGYSYRVDGAEYQLDNPINFGKLKHQDIFEGFFSLSIYFRNYTLVWTPYNDLIDFSVNTIYVLYEPENQIIYKTFDLNQTLPTFGNENESEYRYQKPTYDAKAVKEAREKEPIAVYVYSQYAIDDYVSTAISLYETLEAANNENPLEIGDSGTYSTVDGYQAIAVKLVNNSLFRDVDTYTLVGYCLDGYNEPMYQYGMKSSNGTAFNKFSLHNNTDYWFTFTFTKTIKAKAKGQSGKMVFTGIQNPKYIYIAVKSVHTSDGQTYTIDDDDLAFVYWTK